jgi:hypothetical protein
MKDPLQGLPELGDIDQFASALDELKQFSIYGRHWCPTCRRENRFSTKVEKTNINHDFTKEVLRSKASPGAHPTWEKISDSLNKIDGSLFSIVCANCHHAGRMLIQKISGQISGLVFFDEYNSIATENTPEEVKYYLEQAQACHSVKAFSATFAMYRTALDAILFGQGYSTGMVGEKIKALEKDIKNETAPPWSKFIGIEFLKVIKNLGNSSLHISAEDISSEKNIETADIKEVELAMGKMLFEIYEKNKEEEASLSRLNQLANRKKGK